MISTPRASSPPVPISSTDSCQPRPRAPPQGDRIWKFCGGSPTSLSPGVGVRGRRFHSSSLLFSPPPFQGGGREGGPAPARGAGGGGSSPPAPLPGGRREGGAARPVGGGSTPLPTSPLKGGRSESGGTRERPRRRTGRRTAAGISSAIALHANRRPPSRTDSPAPGRGNGRRARAYLHFSPVYPGLSRSIPVYPGLSRFIPVYPGRFRSIPVYPGPFRFIPVHPGRFRSRAGGNGCVPRNAA